MAEHRVQEGDCMAKIALANGFYWETLWNHSANSSLKAQRKDPFVLNPGDVVTIPEKQTSKKISCKPKEQHSFVRKGTLTKFKLRLLTDDKPIKDTEYTLTIDKKFFAGKTNNEGWIEHMIPANAMEGVLLVGPEEDEQGTALPQERYDLKFGYIDSVDTVKGVKARLKNLGFNCDEESNYADDALIAAVKEFQTKYEIPVNGKWNDNRFQKKLKEKFEGA